MAKVLMRTFGSGKHFPVRRISLRSCNKKWWCWRITMEKKILSVKMKKSIFSGLLSPGCGHMGCIFVPVHEYTSSPIDFVVISGG